MSKSSLEHHIKAIAPALAVMRARGIPAEDCLAGTGLEEQDLDHPSEGFGYSLEQEFRFHRNLLDLTGDPQLGLSLGRAYTLENYGLLGYAFMSAPTLRHALTITRNYGPLSFTLFRIDFTVTGAQGKLRFFRDIDIPPDLLTFYVDRDLSAACFGGSNALQEPFEPVAIKLMHTDTGARSAYEDCFSCPVEFNSPWSELSCDAAQLDHPMPLRDPETSTMCQQQCQLLLARMSSSRGFVTKVRELIVARPGYFPDIEFIAERLNMTSRTLRRRLADEESSYQQILTEVRYELAREYLGTSTLPIEEISLLLGYSAASNFTNAFRRWHGVSPRQYRQENR